MNNMHDLLRPTKIMSLFLSYRIPALRFYFYFCPITAFKNKAIPLFGDMTDHMYSLYLRYFVVHKQRNSKQQFIILSPIHCHSSYIHIELFGHHGCLIIDR